MLLAASTRAVGRAILPTVRVARLPELDAVTVPVLVIQGERDQFGMPPPGDRRTVIEVRGDHSLRSDLATVNAEVGDWLLALSLG